jgi:hypothetical protein
MSVKASHASADEAVVTRSLGLLSIVVTVAIGAYVLSAQMSSQSHAKQSGDRAVTLAEDTAAAVSLQQAAAALDQGHALNGTYAGTSLAGFGVSLARADASTYCVQTNSNGAIFHLAGPGGATAPGRC